MATRSIPRRFSLFLDAARAIAALAVVAQHARTYLFVGPRALRDPSPVVRAFYFLTGFGHEAVMVFFVLSGFLVGGSALSAIEQDRWSWGDYLIKRVTRLSIVLVPALLLTLAWDRSLIAAFGWHSLPVRDHTITIASHAWAVQNWSAAALVGNAIFLMNVTVPTFGTNGSLWSLANEFWYYVAFPLLAIAVLGRRDSLRTLGCVVALLVLYLLLGHEISMWGSIWLMGVLVARAPVLRLGDARVTRVIVASSAVLVAVVLWHDRVITTGIVTIWRDLIVGAAFTLLLYVVRCAFASEQASPNGVEPAGALGAPMVRLAAFSYTLYLVHEPPLAFVHSWIAQHDHAYWRPTALHLALYVAAVVVLVGYARGIAALTEDRTDVLRAWVRRRLITRAATSAGAPAGAAIGAESLMP